MDPGTFFACQLYSAGNNTKGQIVVGGLITTIAQFFNIIPEDDDQVPGSERLDKASFELMSFGKLEAGRLFWIYPGTGLCLFLI